MLSTCKHSGKLETGREQRTLQTLRRVYIDQTGVGEFFVEQARKDGVKDVKGVMLSLPEKENIMGFTKTAMQKGRLRIPYDSELINEIDMERYVQTQTGQTKFSHPNGTHDDRLWALALAVYASRYEMPRFVPFAAFGHISKPRWAILRTKTTNDTTRSERQESHLSFEHYY